MEREGRKKNTGRREGKGSLGEGTSIGRRVRIFCVSAVPASRFEWGFLKGSRYFLLPIRPTRPSIFACSPESRHTECIA